MYRGQLSGFVVCGADPGGELSWEVTMPAKLCHLPVYTLPVGGIEGEISKMPSQVSERLTPEQT